MALFLTGCSENNPISPQSSPESKPNNESNNVFHAYIYVFAEGSPYYMPFSGEAELWAFDTPVANPTAYTPDKHIYWSANDPNPIIDYAHENGKYIYWMGWQNVSPPNEDWETRTQMYSGYAPWGENYYDDCEFYATK